MRERGKGEWHKDSPALICNFVRLSEGEREKPIIWKWKETEQKSEEGKLFIFPLLKLSLAFSSVSLIYYLFHIIVRNFFDWKQNFTSLHLLTTETLVTLNIPCLISMVA